MSRDTNYEPENYRCSNCKYYQKDCKRIDGVKIDFAKPWFKSSSDHGCVCSDFVLKDYMIYAKQNWIDFDTYFAEYVENWLPYENTNTLVHFVVNGDKNVWYGVPLLDYVYGNMYDGNKLKAVEKMYYKRTKRDFGYDLAREEIDGVELI